MKTAIYIEDGVVQLVLTPENSFEKDALASMREKPLETKIFHGAFYDCRGGWVRQKHFPEAGYLHGVPRTKEDDSLIIRTGRQIEIQEPQEP